MTRISPLFLATLLMVGVTACGDNGDKVSDGGADTLPPALNLTYQQLQEACVITGACSTQRYARLEVCVSSFFKIYAENGMKRIYEYMYDCVLKAGGDCRKVSKCMGFAERPQAKEVACDSSFVSRCDGTKAVTCDLDSLRGGWIQTLECADAGLKCALKNTGAQTVAICGGGICNPKKYTPNCQNSKSYSCAGGAIQINDCPAQGMQCRDPSKGTCEGTGRTWKDINPLCCKDFSPACSSKGDVLTRVKGGYLWQIDCSKQPGKKTCSSSYSACKGAGSECSDSTWDACDTDANTLVSCVDGYKEKFDCKKLGFADGCKKSDTGYGAYCRGKWFSD